MELNLTSNLYKNFVKKILFLFDADFTHELIINLGYILGNIAILKNLIKYIYCHKYLNLEQKIAGITFANPVGLAAGFDYQAKLINILPSLNFGFETVGTITNGAYEGNPKPRLGRLINSRSLMVNKGFKNEGVREITTKLQSKQFQIPLGISIGKTNNIFTNTQETAIDDILQAFAFIDAANIKNVYYELNISCPNLSGNVSFYPPRKLDQLLNAVDGLKIKRPIFIKMPIDKANAQILEMLAVISKHKIAGVIFGNVQTDRTHPALIPSEVAKFKKGNFSGKPTEKRSNELIALAYSHYKKQLIIVGCGGIFSGGDAYRKIKLGASLVQLITGLVFEGPQLVSEINQDLSKMVAKDGFKNISQAVGTA